MDVELAHDRPDDRQLLLILRRQSGFHDRPATARTDHGDRRVVAFVDLFGHRTMSFGPVGGTGTPSRTLRIRSQWFRKRRSLTETCPAGIVQLPLQVIDLLAQALVLTLQPIALTLGPFGTLAELACLAPLGHQPADFAIRARHRYARITAPVQAETHEASRFRARTIRPKCAKRILFMLIDCLSGDPGGDRTHDPVIKSHMLYH